MTVEDIVKVIEGAEEVCDPAPSDLEYEKPRLLVENAKPDQTVASLRDLLAGAGRLYDRGYPVRLAFDQIQQGTVAQTMTPDALVLTAHTICRPYALKKNRAGDIEEVDVRLPRSLAVMYLDWPGEWHLPPLNGIASSPLLRDDGSINSAEGYDAATGMWRENVPNLDGQVPAKPSLSEAMAALLLIRETFKTFCFADAEMIESAFGGAAVVDTSKAPGRDESAFLAALITAVCRPSLHLAPGVLVRAASVSGAGTGKGLLARCICLIAFGREPHAVTAGSTADELEKRMSSELMQGGPALFLDNLNNMAVRSDLLASAITERPARVRLLGKSQMVALNSSSFVILTGNGLKVSEDLARRFLTIELDAHTEDPELRPFASDIRLEVVRRRTELLSAVLTIWRWGRGAIVKPGMPIGSFTQWCQWVRDPLLALGCQDPVARISEAKQRDARRQDIAAVFELWWERHQGHPMAASKLDDDVKRALDPQNRGRQYVAARLESLDKTRIAGFSLTRQESVGKWSAATYTLERDDGREAHRDHRGHRGDGPSKESYAPYGPYAGGDQPALPEPGGPASQSERAGVGHAGVDHADEGAAPELAPAASWSARL